MGILSRAGDLVYTFRFLKLLVTDFKDTTAYKLDIIDQKGNRNYDTDINTSDKKSAYNTFHRLVFNVKKIIAMIPGGSSKFASYAAALYLIKEHGKLNDEQIDMINEKCLFADKNSLLAESSNRTILESGDYKLLNDKAVSNTGEVIANAGDYVKIYSNSRPIDSILGINIYEAVHTKTNKIVFVAFGELAHD